MHCEPRPQSLIGEYYLDCLPGTAPEKLRPGARIPVQQTATPVQLDQVLTALQSDTRADLKILLREYGKALDGAGARGFNRSIPYWEPAYRDFEAGLRATIDWYRDHEDWWAPAKDATEAFYASKGQ